MRTMRRTDHGATVAESHYRDGMSQQTRDAIREHVEGFRDRVAKANRKAAAAERRKIYGMSKANRQRYGGDASRFRFRFYERADYFKVQDAAHKLWDLSVPPTGVTFAAEPTR
jgi:hypothetical protein